MSEFERVDVKFKSLVATVHAYLYQLIKKSFISLKVQELVWNLIVQVQTSVHRTSNLMRFFSGFVGLRGIHLIKRTMFLKTGQSNAAQMQACIRSTFVEKLRR